MQNHLYYFNIPWFTVASSEFKFHELWYISNQKKNYLLNQNKITFIEWWYLYCIWLSESVGIGTFHSGQCWNWNLIAMLSEFWIQRYSSQGSKGEHHGYTGIEERASSTAEEFKRMAEEKLKAAEQGVASQTVDQTYDGTEEATVGDSNVDSVKNRYKEHEPGADYKRRPHDD